VKRGEYLPGKKAPKKARAGQKNQSWGKAKGKNLGKRGSRHALKDTREPLLGEERNPVVRLLTTEKEIGTMENRTKKSRGVSEVNWELCPGQWTEAHSRTKGRSGEVAKERWLGRFLLKYSPWM